MAESICLVANGGCSPYVEPLIGGGWPIAFTSFTILAGILPDLSDVCHRAMWNGLSPNMPLCVCVCVCVCVCCVDDQGSEGLRTDMHVNKTIVHLPCTSPLNA